MKTKQIVGIVITCLIIIATGVTGTPYQTIWDSFSPSLNKASALAYKKLLDF